MHESACIAVNFTDVSSGSAAALFVASADNNNLCYYLQVSLIVLFFGILVSLYVPPLLHFGDWGWKLQITGVLDLVAPLLAMFSHLFFTENPNAQVSLGRLGCAFWLYSCGAEHLLHTLRRSCMSLTCEETRNRISGARSGTQSSRL